MINVTFSDSLAGCLKMADYYSKERNSEIQDLKENLFSLYLNLDLGDISEETFGEKRENDFVKMFGNEDIPFMRKWFNCELKKIDKIEKLVKQGHDIRIWYTERTNEFCGFCWLLSMLNLWGVKNNKIFYVKLPQSILFANGKYETFAGSGMFDPEMLPRLVMTQQQLTDSYKNYHIRQWQRVQEENAEMRVSINSQLLSVNADFYDSIITSEIGKLDDTFKQAEAIGNCLAKLWTSDSFVAWRIDEMIKKGLFKIVEQAPEDKSYYCRLLKKRTYGEDNLKEYTEDDRKIIEVYDAYIDEKVHEPGTFWDATNGILYGANYLPEYTPELGRFLDATNGIVCHVKKGNWLVLETKKSFITLGYDGINTYPKDSEFFDTLDYMEPCVDIDHYEEFDGYERTLFLGETIKDSYEKDGRFFVLFDNFSVEIIPLEDNEEVPWYDRKNLTSYKYLYGCERLIIRKCKCGGMGKLLLKYDYDYTVRCDNCKKATEATRTAIDAIKAWEVGNTPNELNDIVVE